MSKTTKNNSRPEGCICEQFVYLLDLAVYPNSSYMNELSVMPCHKLGGMGYE